MLLAIISLVMFFYNYLFALVHLIVIIVSAFILYQLLSKLDEQCRDYFKQLTYRVNEAGKKLFFTMPIGVLIYTEDYHIEWSNPYLLNLSGSHNLIGSKLDHISPQLEKALRAQKDFAWININDNFY